ncbi:MAG: hypothetical protein BGO49_02960 [Planctomycetales bacterium 71-10]|nr:MAG: hypothetical protein BGO49_02960 [Planctomycetales bacterium 71-10]
MPVDAFLGNPATRDSYHYHNVVWNLRNIPIQRHHLDWLPPDYRENEEEYPFVQFSLTQSLGRVVGFWGANKQIFYVVLLDPEHNIWPTESRGYRVDNCWPIATDYERVISAIDAASRLTCEHPNCPFPEAIRNLPTGYDDHRVARLRLTATLWDDFSCLTQYDTNITPDVVFETGIYATLDRLSPTNGGDASRETLVRTVEPANEAEAIEIA